MRTKLSNMGDNTIPAINVQGAFDGGGAQIGNSGTTNRPLGADQHRPTTHGTHTLKWGGRLRQGFLDDISREQFRRHLHFLGRSGPAAGCQQPADPEHLDRSLSALERYRRTLLFQQAGLSDALIRLYGGGASQFSLSAGTPLTSVNQFDVGLFVNDDWRAASQPDIQLRAAVRNADQHQRSRRFFAARRVAWGIDGRASKPAKTVLRAGFGIFFDRMNENVTLQSCRFNGMTQQSYLIQHPDFYPAIPSPGSLAGGQQPQQLQLVDSGIQGAATLTRRTSAWTARSTSRASQRAPTSTGAARTSLRSRDINAPIGGLFPSGDPQVRQLTESTGFSRTNQITISPNVNYKKMFLFGFYALLTAGPTPKARRPILTICAPEWGPSQFRRRAASLGGRAPACRCRGSSASARSSSHQAARPTTSPRATTPMATASPPSGRRWCPASQPSDCRGGNLVLRERLRLLQSEPGARHGNHRPQLSGAGRAR